MQVLGEHFNDGTGFGTRVVVCVKDLLQHRPVNPVAQTHFYFIKFSLNHF